MKLKNSQKEHPAPQNLKFCLKNNVFFLLKKTSQPRKKQKICMKKWQKKYQKEHPDPQKREVLHKKKYFFTQKDLPASQKT